MHPSAAWIRASPSSPSSHVASLVPSHAEPYLYYGQRYYQVMQGQRSTAMLSPYFNQSSFPFVPPGPKPGPKPGPLLSPVSEVGKAIGLNDRRRSRSRRRSRARRSRWVVRGE